MVYTFCFRIIIVIIFLFLRLIFPSFHPSTSIKYPVHSVWKTTQLLGRAKGAKGMCGVYKDWFIHLCLNPCEVTKFT